MRPFVGLSQQPRAPPASLRPAQTWDLRALGPGCRPSGEIKHAHKMPVRSISFAPHADTRILTAGDDCKLRFWDLRCVASSEDKDLL